MNTTPAPATPAYDLFESIQKLCHQPGVLGVVLCPPDQIPLVATFDDSVSQLQLADAWTAALDCITAVRQAGGPAAEFRWVGRTRTFCLVAGPEDSYFGFLHVRDLTPDAQCALEQAVRAVQSATSPAQP